MPVKLHRAASVAALLTAGLLSGCASLQAEIDEAKQMAQQAASDAAAAQRSADSAAQAANEAKTQAGNALRTAQQAQRAADEANRCCAENKERIDRLFREGVRK